MKRAQTKLVHTYQCVMKVYRSKFTLRLAV